MNAQLHALESKIEPALLAQIGVLEAIAGNDAITLALQLICRRKMIRRHLADFDWSYDPFDWPSSPLWYDRPDLPLVPRRFGRPRFDVAFGIWESTEVRERIQRELLDMRTQAVLIGGGNGIPLQWFAEADDWPHDRCAPQSLAELWTLDLLQAQHVLDYLQALPSLADWRRRTGTPNPLQLGTKRVTKRALDLLAGTKAVTA